MEIASSLAIINSDIVDGVPNFDYKTENNNELLKHRNRQAFTVQFSAGLCYSLVEVDVLPKRKGRIRGKTYEYLPFYRRK